MARRRTGDTTIDTRGGVAEQEQTQGSEETRGERGRQGEIPAEEIAQRAYEIYMARGGTEGQDIDDWLRAERELREERERFEDQEARSRR